MSCLPKSKSDTKQNLLITAIVFVCMLFCCAYTSPIYPYYNNSDSAIFMLIGKGITEGKLCYVDMFDHKGPILFFIEALGWKIGGRTGIWIIECVAMTASAFAIVGICKELKSKSTVPLIASAAVLFFTFSHGNLSEDYSLPFIYISLYFAVRYYMSKAERHSPWYGLFYGVSFGVIAFIRINNALIVCSLILCIAVDLLVKKQYKNLFANIIAGVVGIAIIAVPIFAYFYAHSALYDMLYATFLYNLIYAEDSSHAAILSSRFPMFVALYAPLLFAIVVFVMRRKHMPKSMFMALMVTTELTLAMLLYANIYEHYFTLAIPVFSIAVALAVKDSSLKTIYRSARENNWLVIALVVIVAVYGVLSAYRAAAPMYKGYLTNISYDRYHQMNESAGIIPQEERNSVIGFDIPPEWYMDCDMLPCYKYYILQHWWTTAHLNVYGEFLDYVETEHPTWIITRKEINDEGLTQIITEDYNKLEENDYACFYRYTGE